MKKGIGFVGEETPKEAEKEVEFYLDAYLSAEETLDFNKIHKVMTLLDWKYFSGYVPDAETLKLTCRHLFDSVMREFARQKFSTDVSMSTGGFSITLRKDYEVEVLFILEEIYITKDDLLDDDRL